MSKQQKTDDGKQQKTDDREKKAIDLLKAPSAVMIEFIGVLGRVAASSHPSVVWIYGETGTGKELAAMAIHQESGRSGMLVAINCALLGALAISELCGHERGAFTGADRKKEGLLAQAAGGTVFLDEFDKLPKDVQNEFLRIIETREYRMLGSNKVLKANVRFIVASSRDLRDLVYARKMAADLYMRVSRMQLRLPALRHRREDLDQIIDNLCETIPEMAEGKVTVSVAAREAIRELPLYGNVRELGNLLAGITVQYLGPSNVIERKDIEQYIALHPLLDERVLHGDEGAQAGPAVTVLAAASAPPVAAPPVATSPPVAAAPPPSGNNKRSWGALRRPSYAAELRAALRVSQGNTSAVARSVGAPLSTVRYQLTQLGLDIAASSMTPAHNIP